jgi:ASC-1-like (ASCH) protein
MRMVRIKREYFEMICAGSKDLEARTNCAPFKYVLVGEPISFVCGNDSVVRRVVDVRRYRSFDHMLLHEPVSRLTPGYDRDQALAIYRSIYTPEKESAGVLVFSLDSK